MKYKKIELELPPLGEVLTAINKDGIIVIGYFYLREGAKKFYALHKVSNYNEFDYYGSDYIPIKWAKLPKFKSIKKNPPPFGIEVLFSSNHSTNYGYTKGVNLKNFALAPRCKDSMIESWIELEIFKEDEQ